MDIFITIFTTKVLKIPQKLYKILNYLKKFHV
nr:MAG TPA: hypothetical protein [Caudoviricetes sp.]